MALLDANTLLLLLNPALPAPLDKGAGKPVTDVERRIGHLIDSLQKCKTKIILLIHESHPATRMR